MDRHLIRRLLIFIISLNIMAVGVILSTRAVLGTSPISSVPYVLSLGTPMTIGTATLVMNSVFIMIGILIMGRDYKLTYLTSIIMVLIFSVLCDVYTELMSWINPTEYLMQWILIICSALILAFGISLEVSANITMMAGEYLVSFICFRTGAEFGRVKIVFDIVMIISAVAFSFFFFGFGSFCGVREGTIFAAITVGFFVHRFTNVLKKGFYDWIGYRGITAREKE